MPISEEVSDLVQILGNFYTEVEGEEAEENEVDRRAFTRPFAQHEGDVNVPLRRYSVRNSLKLSFTIFLINLML